MEKTTCKTICIHCKHHLTDVKMSGTESRRYEHFCTHPELLLPKEQDPVTGKIGYAQKNDLGRVVLSKQKHPYCRDINHGNCPSYEE